MGDLVRRRVVRRMAGNLGPGTLVQPVARILARDASGHTQKRADHRRRVGGPPRHTDRAEDLIHGYERHAGERHPSIRAGQDANPDLGGDQGEHRCLADCLDGDAWAEPVLPTGRDDVIVARSSNMAGPEDKWVISEVGDRDAFPRCEGMSLCEHGDVTMALQDLELEIWLPTR
jgi:hypothetical protein